LDDLVEGHGGGVVHAGVGGADGGVEAVGGGLVGVAGLVGLLGGGAGGFLVVRLGFGWRRSLGLGRWGYRFRAGLAGWRGVCVGARFSIEGELATVCDYERLVLLWHDLILSDALELVSDLGVILG
jgi:hypothetical protein